METAIAVAVLIAIVGSALWYVIRAKKRGQKCIGCPNGGCNAPKNTEQACSGVCSCCQGCSHGKTE